MHGWSIEAEDGDEAIAQFVKRKAAGAAAGPGPGSAGAEGAHHGVLSGACRVIPTLLLVSQLFVKARNREASLYDAYSAINFWGQ
ncbi:hypothetical protein GPECTOR_46g232 [Gonium pectorale]|uniref:Uncharacterized protein n=1 Tax=Gonium pectorale TaxID=33097 RepID=A0A150G8S2_GONPE|nr:hypothetical protein GPECTOR_46g232 [Gonium pectorale]|eukprot:KXZ46163.1 hypothetical protein GPECTOR_46g232 [Gonium pectorale]